MKKKKTIRSSSRRVAPTRKVNLKSSPTSKMKKTMRKSKFTLLMTDDELDHLHELADEDGEPASVFLRRLIRLTWHAYAGSS